jgi:hypothetical protein
MRQPPSQLRTNNTRVPRAAKALQIIYIFRLSHPPKTESTPHQHTSTQDFQTFFKAFTPHHTTTTNNHPSINMDTIKNAGNYVSDKISGTGHEASKEANKNVAKDSNQSISDR